MSPSTVNPALSEAVEQFAQQHRELIDLVNDLQCGMTAAGLNDVAAEVLKDLMDYAYYHAHVEASLMGRFGYPGLAAHIQEHEAFISCIQGMTARVSSTGTLTKAYALSQWLKGHVMGVDDTLSSYFGTDKAA